MSKRVLKFESWVRWHVADSPFIYSTATESATTTCLGKSTSVRSASATRQLVRVVLTWQTRCEVNIVWLGGEIDFIGRLVKRGQIIECLAVLEYIVDSLYPNRARITREMIKNLLRRLAQTCCG